MKTVFAAFVALAVVTVGSAGLAGATGARQEPFAAGGSEHYIVEGGTVQSVDDTAIDYVTPGADGQSGAVQSRNAAGYQPINGFTFSFRGKSLKVTTGDLQHRIIGKGNYIKNEWSQYRVPSTICNWRVDYQNRNGGKIHRTFVGKSTLDAVLVRLPTRGRAMSA